MAALYLDSSALVKRYVQEIGSAWVSTSTNSGSGNLLYISPITGVEVVAAIARKARTGGISLVDATTALANFRADFPANFTLVEVTASLITEAMRLAEDHGLRAYDAMQLAGAVQMKNERAAAGLTLPVFVSAEISLNSSAQTEGLSIDDPNAHP